MIDGQTLQISTGDACGLSGALLYSAGYLLAAYDRMPSQSPIYYATKLIAALLVLISLVQDFNLASAIIQVFFITVSMIGIARHFGPERRAAAEQRSLSQRAPQGGGFAGWQPPLSGRPKATPPYARQDL